jgi:manganese-dependent ADP-ribose/CDP-alcohol diphosphatase
MELLITYFFATLLFVNMQDGNPTIKSSQNEVPLLSFGIVADVQYADIDHTGTRFYRNSASKLQEAYNTFRNDSVDFAINLGDLIDGNYDSFKPVLDIILSSGIKTYHVTGNHDYAVDKNLKDNLPVMTGSGKNYYSYKTGEFRFIILDGNEISTYASENKSIAEIAAGMLDSLKAKGAINAMQWNGGLSNNQITWLDNQLRKANKEKEKVFLICHFPIYPENAHNLLNYNELLSLVEKYHNIIAWFNGHNHAGNYGNFNLIHFVTFRGMVETEAENSFAIVDVYKNKLWIRGFGREKSRILAY